MQNKSFIPYDLYERHRKVGSFISDGESVLDVGGELNHLSQFCNPKKIVVANLNTGDVLIEKGKLLPFKNNSFDCVCAIDVLEHIPQKERTSFIKELIRVCAKKVILSFPIGTARHAAYERETQTWLERTGQNISYLKEHIKYHLPTVSEIEALTKNFDKKIIFSGQLTINKYLFRLFIFDPNIKVIRKLVFNFKKIFYFISNPFFYVILSHKEFSENANRAYVFINKNKK